jgi:hypothetical protein
MLLTIVQPSYFPPLAHFAKALCADVVVHAESFQFRKHDFVHRTAIKTVAGARWLSLPILSKAHSHDAIDEMKIDARQPWNEAHLRSLVYNYHNAAWYDYYADGLETILKTPQASLGALLTATNRFLRDQLAPAMKVISSRVLPRIPDRTGRLLAWLEAAHCDSYLLWPHEMSLLEAGRLAENGIRLERFTYDDRPYYQQFGAYLPGLGLLDLLLNEGPAAADWLRCGARRERAAANGASGLSGTVTRGR